MFAALFADRGELNRERTADPKLPTKLRTANCELQTFGETPFRVL
jgi:hypothetical protein